MDGVREEGGVHEVGLVGINPYLSTWKSDESDSVDNVVSPQDLQELRSGFNRAGADGCDFHSSSILS